MIRSTTLIDAPQRTVAGLLRDSQVVAAALARCGHRLTSVVRLLAPGDEVRIDARILPGVRVPVRMVVQRVTRAGMTAALAAGPLPELVHDVMLTRTGAGTLVLDELRWTGPFGPLGRVADVVLVRGLVLRMLAARAEVLARSATALGAAGVVVATALHRDGRLLVAQRTRPPALAGRWELPGGRVEAGESEADAVSRECREELGVPVVVAGRLGTDLPIDVGVLRVHVAVLPPGAPEPRALDHAAVRWVGVDELAGVDWVDADRAVVADLRALLESGFESGAEDGRRSA